VRAGESATVHASESATVHAAGRTTVHAMGRATVHASESATVHAWESATVHTWESATVHAAGNVFVRVFSALRIIASAHVVIMLHGAAKSAEGGQQIAAYKPTTPRDWCEHYAVPTSDGVATLFKALDDDFSTEKARATGIFYRPGGTIPTAPDWDGGKKECGGGLHFSPTPTMAMEFNSSATRFIACPVHLSDIAVHSGGRYPHKVKARACCAPVWEVNEDGKRIEAASVPEAAGGAAKPGSCAS
jgi:hypothetical protein